MKSESIISGIRANKDYALQPHSLTILLSSAKIGIPEGYSGHLRPISKFCQSRGIDVGYCTGIYASRERMLVPIINLTDKVFTVKKGDYIAILELIPGNSK